MYRARLFPAGDQEAVEGDAGDNREAIGPGTDDGRQLLHERPAPLHGQVEGRGPEERRGRGGTVVAHDRDWPAPSERRFVTHVRPRGVPRRVARRGPALLVRAGYHLADVFLPDTPGSCGMIPRRASLRESSLYVRNISDNWLFPNCFSERKSPGSLTYSFDA